jgi:hypothetical protein
MNLYDLRGGYVWICVVVNNLYANVAVLNLLYVNFVMSFATVFLGCL